MSRAMPRPDPDSLKAHFAYELRRLRAKAELSQQQLATALGCTPQWIWQLENCETTVSPQTARDLDVHFETEGRETDDGLFHRLYRSIKKAELSRVLLPGFDSYLEFEQRANIIRCFTAQVVHGLLQTEAYTRGLMSPQESEETLETRVGARQERQASVFGREAPPRTVFILDESFLHRPVGGPKAMVEQLDHLIGLATSPGVHIHVLPYSAIIPEAYVGAFNVLSFENEADIVYAEPAGIGQLIEIKKVVMESLLCFDTLMGEAHSRIESARVMSEAREAYL